MALIATTQLAISDDQHNQSLKVVVGENHVLAFDEQAPVQGLMSFQNIVLGQLLYATDSYSIEPGMLKEYRWNFKENCYELELREGVVFHNGRHATAEDVEFSLTRGLFTKKYSWIRVFLSNIEGINAIRPGEKYRSKAVSGIQITGPRTLKIKLSQPNPAFLLSLGRSTFALVPKEELKEDLYSWKRYPVGAGLYKVSSVDQKQGLVVVEKTNAHFNGPVKIEFSSAGTGVGEDLIIVGIDKTNKLKSQALSKATSVTGIFFNFENPLARSLEFRSAVEKLVRRDPLVAGVSEYVINTEILASHQYGRAGIRENHSLEESKKLLSRIFSLLPKGRLKIPVFNSGFGNDKYGKYLDILASQFQNAGLEVEFFDSPKKFFDESDKNVPFRIVSPGADPADSLVIFNLFKNGSPFAKHAPENDQIYEKLLSEAASAQSLDVKAQTVRALSQYVFDQKYFIPLFERRPVIFYNPRKIKSLGEQNGGLTFFFNRLELANASET